MSDYDRKRKCDVCGEGFTRKQWTNRHDFHEPDCLRTSAPLKASYTGYECDCDLIAHETCCPFCNPESEWAKKNEYPANSPESP